MYSLCKLTPHLNTPLKRSKKTSAFSLVEVAIAVGILAVALVALMALLPVGMNDFRKAMDISVTAQIAQRIVHDMEQAEFSEVIDITNLPSDPTSYCPPHYSFRAPTVQSPALRYFDEQGVEIIPAGSNLSENEKKAVLYYVNIRIIPRAQLPIINETASQVAQITIQIARNPGHRELMVVTGSDSNPDVPDRNLFQKTSGVNINTYYSLIGRNQGK